MAGVDGSQAGIVALFFVSYVLIVGVVLMNIVVAVLLDEFITTVAMEKSDQRQKEIESHSFDDHSIARTDAPLDPLIRGLLSYASQEDLLKRISNLYQVTIQKKNEFPLKCNDYQG
jgi:hypothetical protein